MKYISRTVVANLFALMLSIPLISVADEDPHAKHRAMMKQKSQPTESVDIDLRDQLLIDQDGRELMFVNDVIGDNIVVMDFVYTTCTTICPVLSALFTQVQTKLGDEVVGSEVRLVSMSVDPIRDTPQRLKAYSAKHRAGEGWLWLTGPKPAVDDVLTGLGAYTSNFEDHPSMVLIGDGRTGEWKRLFGFPNPDRIVQIVNDLREQRRAGG
jgi:protein SCO1/2